MTYADQATLDTALDTLIDQLPEMCVPVGKITVENGSAGLFTAGATNWNAADITTTVTDASVGTWDRTANTGWDSHQINPPAIPASITAALIASLAAAKPTAGPATLTAGDPTASAPTLTAGDPTASAATLTAGDPTASAATLTAGDPTASSGSLTATVPGTLA
jgi:hypothetical protein